MTFPAVPETFYWTSEAWGPALRCRPLEAVAQHVFTSRQLELPSAEASKLLAPLVGAPPDRFLTLNQVHGRDVVIIRRGIAAESVRQMQKQRPVADAFVSNAPDVAVVVRAADCVPLLIADRATGAVAAIHAGWRGTAARAAVAAIDAMAREFSSRPVDLIVAIGPAIGPCCYEVGSDLVDAFAAAGHERYLIDRWFMTPRGSRMRLDVSGANRDQLILAGVPEPQILSADLCTAEHLGVLTSYRAEKERATRIGGVIRASSVSL
jgi:YfiH family protein